MQIVASSFTARVLLSILHWFLETGRKEDEDDPPLDEALHLVRELCSGDRGFRNDDAE